MTIDPLVMWNPDALIDKPGNWHATRYAGNDPMNLVDTSGQSAFVLIDPNGANGSGHTAIIFGNQKNGFHYFSQGAINATNILQVLISTATEGLEHFSGKMPGALIKDIDTIKGYYSFTHFAEFQTSIDQDSQMFKFADRRLNQIGQNKYNLLFNNCADFVKDTLMAGGIESKKFFKPNSFFDGIVDTRAARPVGDLPSK
jgi:hypothetical protein